MRGGANRRELTFVCIDNECNYLRENIIKIRQKISAGLLALLPLFTLMAVTSPANAEHSYTHSVTPRIEGFNVDEVRRLAPGVELNFSVYGTPGGTAVLLIAGARRNLTLNEVEAGQYEGAYTISSRDAITARSSVTANLRVANKVTTAVLSESLQADASRRSRRDNDRANTSAPRIEQFNVQPSDELNGGSELTFTLYGTPGGKADIAINGVKGKIFLDEVKRGEYSGTYTIKRRDRIESNSVVTANLRLNDRVTTMTLGKPLLLGRTSAPAVAAPAQKVIKYCSNCGKIEAVNLIEVKGDGTYLGTIGGGVVGALLGSQVGKGNGRTAAQIAGAIGGAYAGRAIEKNAKKASHYEVLVRLQTGGTQTFTYETDPGVKIGEDVKITDAGLVRN